MQLHNTLIDLLADARGRERHIRFIDGEDASAACSLAYVSIEYPVIAVALDSLSGTLFKPSFVDAQTQIFLDRDTHVPFGHEWNLDAPCTVVVASNTDLHALGRIPRVWS